MRGVAPVECASVNEPRRWYLVTKRTVPMFAVYTRSVCLLAAKPWIHGIVLSDRAGTLEANDENRPNQTI